MRNFRPLVRLFGTSTTPVKRARASKKRKKGFMQETQIGDLYQVKKKSQNNNKNYY
jgi:hypothetical protein